MEILNVYVDKDNRISLTLTSGEVTVPGGYAVGAMFAIGDICVDDTSPYVDVDASGQIVHLRLGKVPGIIPGKRYIGHLSITNVSGQTKAWEQYVVRVWPWPACP